MPRNGAFTFYGEVKPKCKAVFQAKNGSWFIALPEKIIRIFIPDVPFLRLVQYFQDRIYKLTS